MALVVAGGAFYIVGGLGAGFILGGLIAFTGGLSGQSMTTQANTALGTYLGWGLATGVLIIIGGLLVNSPSGKRRKIGGALAIIVALLGIINTLAGLAIGFVLTFAGAIIGLTYKEPEPTQQVTSEVIKVRCQSCGHLNEETATFCQRCGAKIVVTLRQR